MRIFAVACTADDTAGGCAAGEFCAGANTAEAVCGKYIVIILYNIITSLVIFVMKIF